MRDAALAYASEGYKVFPIHTMRAGACSCGGAKNCKPAKHPIGNLAPRGVLNATKNPEVVAGWWAKEPNANIGIATGQASGIVALDVDGPTGETTLAKLERRFGTLPPTRQIKTGKGRHLYFRYPRDTEKVKSIAQTKLGLDVRADGGYVLAPPSLHASGTRYSVESSNVEANCPAWLVAYANDPSGTLKAANSAASAFQGQQPAPVFATLDPQADNLANGIRTSAPMPYSETEGARVRSALAHISASERDTWRDIGFALHSLGWGERAFQIWSEWARTCPEKFDEAGQQKTWESFDRPYSGARIGIGTLFHKASATGWVDSTRQPEFRTDLGNARRLVKRHGANIRYVPEWKRWLVWSDGHWSLDSDGAIMRLAKETVAAMYAEAMSLNPDERDALLGHAIHSQAEARLKAMVSLAESEAPVVVSAGDLDTDPWLLGVQNGVLELQTGQFRAARREDLITKRAGVSYDPNAQCPEWLNFLDTIMGGDAALQAYLQRVVGYTLTGSVREEVMFVLHGTGNNGKSTYRETLHSMLGDYALAADAGLLTERKKGGGPTEEIARLKGRRLVAVNETAENEHLNEARVKFVTSQDTITARNLYGHLFDFFPSHKTSVTTNHKPIVRGTDEGIWRRLHLIPFTVTIPNVEKDFRERRLMPELAGILNWALAGVADYLKRGLAPPPAVRGATQDYRKDMDVVGQWIEEQCEEAPGASIPTALAYGDYNRWAQDEVGWTLSKLSFRRHLADRGFGAKKGTGGRREIEGLRFKIGFGRQALAGPIGTTGAHFHNAIGPTGTTGVHLHNAVGVSGVTGPYLH